MVEKRVTAKENLDHDYGRLRGFLRGIAHRFRLLAAFEILLLFPSGLFLVLLGSFFVFELKTFFPYLPFLYALFALLFLVLLFLFGIRRVVSRLPKNELARRVEEIFPDLKDDLTNSLLLGQEVRETVRRDPVSGGLILAQLRKTLREIASIHPRQVVHFKTALRHLRIFLPLFAAFLLTLAVEPQFLSRSAALILHPFSHLPDRQTSLSLEATTPVILRGTPVVLHAQAKGHIPDRLTLTVWTEGRDPLSFAMDPLGNGRFRHRIASVSHSFRYQAGDGKNRSPIHGIQVVDPPDLGKIRLTLVPPGYTGLPADHREGGGIEALKGTVVKIDADVTKEITEGKVILDQDNQLLLEIKGRRLTGSLLVLSPGTYHLKVKDELGFENPDPVHYPIALIPDRYPEIEVIRPGQDLEISGNETLEVVYSGRDDFGITAIRLAYQIGSREGTVSLKGSDSGRSFGPVSYRWDLGALNLAPGERVAYRLEILDNDSVSGPKKGTSPTYLLSVRDDRAQAFKEGEEAQRIAEALLDLLADQIEDLKERTELSKGLNEVLNRVDSSLARMRDRMDRFELEALRRNLSSLRNRIEQESRETVTQELERLALLAEDIGKRARMNEVEALAREIRNRQRRLLEMMKEMKTPLSKEGTEEILKELRKLEELIRSVMETLSKMATRLPEEFVNSPEMSGLDFQDLFQDLDEIRNRLMAGDLSAAMEAAQRLLQALSEMVAQLARAGAQAGMAPFDRLQGEMSRQSGELEKILAEQKEVLRETEKIEQTLTRRMREAFEKRLEEALPDLEDRLCKLRRSLPPDLNEMLEELKELLQKEQIERFSRMLEKLEQDLAERPEAQKELRALREKIDHLTPDGKEGMDPENRGKFPPMTRRQKGLRERTERLKERLEMLAQLFPGMDTEILNHLKGAADSMEEASGKLKEEDASGAVPPEERAIQRLSQSQQAMQQMAQQMVMQMQASRWGYPYGYDPRPGWYYGPWIPMPTLPQPEFRRPRERGYTGIEREEFEPPSKDAYQVPKIFREKVVESLKEEVPSRYRKDVEQYFRELTK